jgi:selT/selW/selH-like putative selenoprotein
VSLAEELLGRWAPVLAGVELKTGSKGRFEIHIDGDEIFSKARLDRFPNKGEVVKILQARLGSPPEWRASSNQAG